jgi:DNA-binding GntR family transcriptional regulator
MDGRLPMWSLAAMKDSRADSLRRQVYQTLRRGLRKGQLGSAASATERELAAELGVSRTPVREALVLLMHEGLILSTGRGFVPSRPSPQAISELFEVRRMLEPAAVASSIEHLSAHDLGRLAQSLKQQEAADRAGDVDSFITANSSFRATWLAAVPNSYLRTLIEGHDDHVQWLRHVTLHEPRIRKKVLVGLRRILAALRGGKPGAAATAMSTHLHAAEQALAAAVARAGGGDRSAA